MLSSAVPTAAPSSTENPTIATPSLSMLSPSTMVNNLSGTPSCLKMATTATGSVAEMKTPNSRAAVTGTPSPKYSAVAMSAAEMNSEMIASMRIGTRLRKKARLERPRAAAKISAGRKTKTRTSSNAWPSNRRSTPRDSAIQLTMKPTTTSNAVSGRPTRRANRLINTAPARSMDSSSTHCGRLKPPPS